jgi:hypothetical protein
MPTVAFRVNRSRRAFVNAPKVRDVLSKALDDEVKPHFIKAFEKYVVNWKHKPKFEGRKFIAADSIKVNVYPTGGNKQIYLWVTEGTKEHDITPKSGGFLWFVSLGGRGVKSYVPKTGPGGSWYGGPGISLGHLRSVRAVHHPGNKPRDFEARVRKDEAPWYSRTMNNAWKRAIRAMQS